MARNKANDIAMQEQFGKSSEVPGPRNQIEYLEKELANANDIINRQNGELLLLYRQLHSGPTNQMASGLIGRMSY